MKFTSAILTQASGSLGGATASRNKGGGYFRARVAGTNPQTDAQTAQRGLFAAISAAWRSLTDAQRDAWKAAASAFPYTDSLGQVKTYSGSQLYNSLNGGILSANPGAALLTDPPAPVTFPTLSNPALGITNDAGTMFLASPFSPATVPTYFAARIYATPGLSAGVSNPPTSAYKLIKVQPAAGNILSGLNEYTNVIGAAAIGSKVFVSIDLVSTDSGQKKEVFNTSCIVAAA